AQVLRGRQLAREEIDRSAIGRGPNGGRVSRGAVEVDAANPGRREEGPRVMRRIVCVVEGDAVEGDVVTAVSEATEVGLGVTKADAVRIDGEGAGRLLNQLAEVRCGRGEVLDEGGADFGA